MCECLTMAIGFHVDKHQRPKTNNVTCIAHDVDPSRERAVRLLAMISNFGAGIRRDGDAAVKGVAYRCVFVLR
jgi:hypothetical protein